jgi:hypothetical protein
MRQSSRQDKAGPAVVIMTVASVIGAAAGALTYMASRSLPQALLTAGTAAGGTINLLTQITGTSSDRQTRSQDNNQHDDHSDSSQPRET